MIFCGIYINAFQSNVNVNVVALYPESCTVMISYVPDSIHSKST